MNLIRAKRAFAETLRNIWNLSTKSGLIQNLWLWALSHFCHWNWKHYILHTKVYFFTIFQMPLNRPYPSIEFFDFGDFHFLKYGQFCTQNCQISINFHDYSINRNWFFNRFSTVRIFCDKFFLATFVNLWWYFGNFSKNFEYKIDHISKK